MQMPGPTQTPYGFIRGESSGHRQPQGALGISPVAGAPGPWQPAASAQPPTTPGLGRGSRSPEREAPALWEGAHAPPPSVSDGFQAQALQ